MNDDYRDSRSQTEKKKVLPVIGEVRPPAIWWPLVWGIIFLIAGIVSEYILQLSGGTIVEGAHGTVQGTPATPSGLSSLIFRWESLIVFMKELGYAFIIGWIVSYSIDAAAKREQNASFKDQMNQIGQQAFRGVFGLKHDEKYVRSVIDKCLEAKLIREGYSIAYTLDQFTPAEARRNGFELGRFIKVTAEVRYRARNVGTERDKFSVGYGIPVRSGKLQALSHLKSLKVGTETYTADAIRKAIVDEASEEKGHPDEVKYRFGFELNADDSVEIVMEAQLLKEASDSETFGFGLPTMDARLTLAANFPNMILGATSRIIGNLETERAPDDGRKGEWKIDHPILPYNSVILWWRTKADDGSDSPASSEAPAGAMVSKAGEPSDPKTVKRMRSAPGVNPVSTSDKR